MPQVLKDEVRSRIDTAALEVFASDGVERATMAAIAERAGIGTASIYRYYASKDELLARVVPPQLTRRFESLLDRRVSALARSTLRGETVDDAGGEMLQFWVEHRLAVVILLDRAHYGARFVELLSKHTLVQIRSTHPGANIDATARFVLDGIFENTRRMLASILERYGDPDALRAAVQTFWSYQIAGLRAFAAHIAG